MAKQKKKKQQKREGATWVDLGTDGHLQLRLSRAIESAGAKPLRQEAEEIYNQVYRADLPRPTFGVFLSGLIELSLQQLRQDKPA